MSGLNKDSKLSYSNLIGYLPKQELEGPIRIGKQVHFPRDNIKAEEDLVQTET